MGTILKNDTHSKGSSAILWSIHSIKEVMPLAGGFASTSSGFLPAAAGGFFYGDVPSSGTSSVSRNYFIPASSHSVRRCVAALMSSRSIVASMFKFSRSASEFIGVRYSLFLSVLIFSFAFTMCSRSQSSARLPAVQYLATLSLF